MKIFSICVVLGFMFNCVWAHHTEDDPVTSSANFNLDIYNDGWHDDWIWTAVSEADSTDEAAGTAEVMAWVDGGTYRYHWQVYLNGCDIIAGSYYSEEDYWWFPGEPEEPEHEKSAWNSGFINGVPH